MEEIQKLTKIVDLPVYLLRGTPYIIKQHLNPSTLWKKVH